MKPFNLDTDPKIETGFILPENYFNQFEAKVMNQLLEQKEVPVVSLFKTRKLWYSGIAAVLFLSISLPLYLNTIQKNTITEEDYLAYDNSVTIEELTDKLSDNDIAQLEQSLVVYDEDTKTYVEEYLY